MALVGIIANPASGKDIRRLTAYGSVFDNQEKVRIVRRVLLGLAATGVDEVLYLPDTHHIFSQAADPLDIPVQSTPTPLPIRGSQEDSIEAARFMEQQKAGCIVTLGGDGTNRVAAKGTSLVPLVPISTGTNNVFPYMVEGTLAGMAAGLVAKQHVSREICVFRSTQLEVVIDGRKRDIALVDAAVCNDIFIGSRAVWDLAKVSQIFLNRAAPDTIGLSAIGGLVHPILPQSPQGLYLKLGKNGFSVTAPIAPGMVEPVSIEELSVMEPEKEVGIQQTPCVLALDGEREVEIEKGQTASLRLSINGPYVVDIKAVMAEGAENGILKKRFR